MNIKTTTLAAAATLAMAASAGAAPMSAADKAQVHYRFEKVGDVNVFYREAGDPAAPTIVLLHGFAGSSFMYRDVIPALSDRYHVVAPDLPSFGYTRSAGARTLRLHLRQHHPDHGPFYRAVEAGPLRHHGARLRRASGLAPGAGPSCAHHGHHLAERQRL